MAMMVFSDDQKTLAYPVQKFCSGMEVSNRKSLVYCCCKNWKNN